MTSTTTGSSFGLAASMMLLLLYPCHAQSLLVRGSTTPSLNRDLTVRYFSDAELLCDHPALNLSTSPDVNSLHWIFPDGTLVNPNTHRLDPALYSLQGNPNAPLAARFQGYNLTLLAVNDDVFGYYTCVILYSSPGSQSQQIATVRWGLNVDGADFSELLDDYKQNAIVGGIAAGVLLVVLIIGFLVWYFWCYEKLPVELPVELPVDPEKQDEEKRGVSKVNYQNSAFEGEKTDRIGNELVTGNVGELNSKL